MANEREIRRWAAWLRANPHRQARGVLRKLLPDGTVLVCAIGALEEASVAETTSLFSPVYEDRLLRHVVRMNDDLGWSFVEIARWLELIADGAITLREALAVRDPADLPPYEPPADRRDLPGTTPATNGCC